MPKRVLFLCTGNYYRSRFAEELFNHHAERRGLDWAAYSAALAIERGHENVGPISRHTAEALAARQIPLAAPCRSPRGCGPTDLSAADVVVALKEAEHRALLRAKFPGWEDRVVYWHVHDVDQASPAAAIAMIEELVEALVEQCAAGAVVEGGSGVRPAVG